VKEVVTEPKKALMMELEKERTKGPLTELLMGLQTELLMES
jgi:hypothetical protein